MTPRARHQAVEVALTARARAELAQLELTQPERITLNDQIYNDLRRLIISGRLRPGQTISLRTLAR